MTTNEQHLLIERLLVERISRRRIYRAVGSRLRWLLQVRVERFEAAPDRLTGKLPPSRPEVILPRLARIIREGSRRDPTGAEGSGQRAA